MSDLSLDRDLTSLAGRLGALTAIVARAAAAVLATDPTTASRRQKTDLSPVTCADEAAQELILQGLSDLVPGLPAICEETAGPQHPNIAGEWFALIDPLDGTREFLDGRPEFTVNLAIVFRGAAMLGIVAAPALGLIWRGVIGRGAHRLRFDPAHPGTVENLVPIRTAAPPVSGLRVLVSRSHLDTGTRALLSRLTVSETIACGSSLKFCRLAEGAADLYPRLAPTCEWDIAAGDALLAAAGGAVKAPNGAPLRYGRSTEGFRVPAFLAFGDTAAADRILDAAQG